MVDNTPSFRSRRTIITVTVVSVGLIIVSNSVLTSQQDTADEVEPEGDSAGMSTGDGETNTEDEEGTECEATVSFTDQTTDGMSVIVDSTTLPDGGFVTIHDETLCTENDPVSSVIGVSPFLGAGDHEQIEIELFGDVQGAEFDQESLTEDQTLIAMPHRDINSSEDYEFVTNNGQEDGPYTVDDEAIVDDACIKICNLN